jgi:hypothetical protein
MCECQELDLSLLVFQGFVFRGEKEALSAWGIQVAAGCASTLVPHLEYTELLAPCMLSLCVILFL